MTESLHLVVITGMSGAGKTVAIQSFEDMGYFCVDNMPPGLIPKFWELIRESGKVTKIALVVDLRSRSFFEDIQKMLDKNIILTIGSKEAGDAVNELAQNKKARVHLKIDTGFGRYGFIYNEKEKMVENIKQWNNIQIEGTFSHFSLAFFGNGKEAQEQFSRLCSSIEKRKN